MKEPGTQEKKARLMDRLRRKKKGQAQDKQESASEGIAERVRFWEEQDRINQVLIPRVIRQGELLANHIKEHENLPKLFQAELTKAVSDLKKARDRNLQEADQLFQHKLSEAVTDLRRAHARASREAATRLAQETKRLTWLMVWAFIFSLMALAGSIVSLLS